MKPAKGEEGLVSICATRPEVVLLDWRMPKLDGLGVLQRLKGSDFFPPTIILTTFDDDEIVIEGLRAGAKGYLLKDVTLDELVQAIKTVARGELLIQPNLAERLMRGITNHSGPAAYSRMDNPEALTEREAEVLRLVAGGYNNKQIARSFNITEGTVKNHVSSVLGKLGVRDRTQAVLRALELGLI